MGTAQKGGGRPLCSGAFHAQDPQFNPWNLQPRNPVTSCWPSYKPFPFASKERSQCEMNGTFGTGKGTQSPAEAQVEYKMWDSHHRKTSVCAYADVGHLLLRRPRKNSLISPRPSLVSLTCLTGS